MADEDGRRVEARLSMATGGLRGSPEHIEVLRQRQAEAERVARRGAPGAFARVLGAAGGADGPAASARRRQPQRGVVAPSGRPRRGIDGADDEDVGGEIASGPARGPIIIRP